MSRSRYVGDKTSGIFTTPSRNSEGQRIYRLYIGQINGGNNHLGTITAGDRRGMFSLHDAEGTLVDHHKGNVESAARLLHQSTDYRGIRRA